MKTRQGNTTRERVSMQGWNRAIEANRAGPHRRHRGGDFGQDRLDVRVPLPADVLLPGRAAGFGVHPQAPPHSSHGGNPRRAGQSWPLLSATATALLRHSPARSKPCTGSRPSEARQAGAVLHSQPQLRFHLRVEGNTDMKHRIEDKSAFRLIGLKARVPLVHEGPNQAIIDFQRGLDPAVTQHLVGLCGHGSGGPTVRH